MRKLLAYIFIFCLTLGLVSAIPEVGHQFYGYAVGGDNVEVRAADGSSFTTPIDADGNYGYDPVFFVGAASDDMLGAMDSQDITFYVDGEELGSYTFAIGGVTELNFDEEFGFTGPEPCEGDECSPGYCADESDCDGYACEGDRCVDSCTIEYGEPVGCAEGYVCTELGVCVIGEVCSDEAECDGYACLDAGVCSQSCSTDDGEPQGCAEQYVCDDGTCIPGVPCEDAEDCGGYACLDDGVCAIECTTDGATPQGCDEGYVCNAGACVIGEVCSDDSECDGYQCLADGVCAISCNAGECADGYSCTDGVCTADLSTSNGGSSNGGGSSGTNGDGAGSGSGSYTIPCHHEWECGDWGTCQSDGTQTRECSYTGTCYYEERQPELVQDCEYVAPPVPQPVASCTDGIRNQGERGVDCGGPCPACDAAEPIVEEPSSNLMYILLAVLLLLVIAGVIIAHKYRDGKLQVWWESIKKKFGKGGSGAVAGAATQRTVNYQQQYQQYLNNKRQQRTSNQKYQQRR